MIRTLAIETSCDDTSIWIINFDNNIFNVEKLLAYSQVQDHLKYGGVVPEVASRLHSEKIIEILKQFEQNIKDIDFITVTSSPWLPWSLIVWVGSANIIWEFFNKPVINVNHIMWHLFSLMLERDITKIQFPLVVLTASGWHNEIYLIENWELNNKNIKLENLFIWKVGPYHFYKLGQSLDDAAWECFDKVSRMLWWPYPGWVWVSKNALLGKPNPKYQFNRIFLKADEYNFSFSWMKSQVYYLLKKLEEEWVQLTTEIVQDICYEFQEAVVEVLSKKLVKSAIEYWAKTIGISGWVSANDRLYEYALDYKNKKMWDWIDLLKPIKKIYSTDNAAMIGVVGIIEYLSN